MRATTFFLLSGLLLSAPAVASNCTVAVVASPSLVAPVATELETRYSPLGLPGGVLAMTYDESQSLDRVLLRIRSETCFGVTRSAPTPDAINPADPAAYKPRTKYDNAPWRFNMSQNGRQMTADEFSAWMKARGVRVARGKAPVAAHDDGQAPAAAEAPGSADAATATTGSEPDAGSDTGMDSSSAAATAEPADPAATATTDTTSAGASGTPAAPNAKPEAAPDAAQDATGTAPAPTAPAADAPAAKSDQPR